MSDYPPQKHDPEAALTSASRRGMRATIRGIVASTVLDVVKVVSGILGNSYALIADGVESMLDTMSSTIVWGSLRLATQSANERHHYGYGKAEPLAALAVATALLGAAVGIAIQSIREIQTPHHMSAPFTLAVLIGVVTTKEAMFRILMRTGEVNRKQSYADGCLAPPVRFINFDSRVHRHLHRPVCRKGI